MPVHQVSRFGLVNAYLVEEDDGLTLIDTMIPGSAKKILAAADREGAPIRRIALTHAHADHIGSLDALAAELGEVEVIISERDERPLRKDLSLDPGEPVDEVRGGYPGAETRPTGTVNHGDRIGSLEVVATPGHTPGHIALLDQRDGTLYTGDAFTTLGGVETCARRNFLFPLPYSATWHRPTALESARVLRRLDPQRLATGHGRVLESPAAKMDKAIARAE